MTRIVIHLNDYDTDLIVNEVHCIENPNDAGDERALVNGINTEWYPAGGNIHVLDENVEQVSQMVDGSVAITRDDGTQRTVENAIISSVYQEE